MFVIRNKTALLIAFLISLPLCSFGYGYELKVRNPGDRTLTQYPVEVDAKQLPAELRVMHLTVRNPNGDRVTSQVDDLDDDGDPEKLLFLVTLEPGQTKRVVLEPSSSPYDRETVGEERAWYLWGEPNLTNHWLQGQLPPARLKSEDMPPRWPPDTPMPFDPMANVSLYERTTDSKLFEFILSSTKHLIRGDSTQYAESGPVRGMIERTRPLRLRGAPDRSFIVTQRYYLYEKSRRLDVEVLVTNPGKNTRKLPANFRVLDGRMGDVLVRNPGKVTKTGKRGGQFWWNPSTNYSLMYMPHPDTQSGFEMNVDRFGVNYFRFAPSIGRRLRLTGNGIELDPKQTGRFRCSFELFHGDEEATRKRVAQLAAEVKSKVELYGPDESVPTADVSENETDDSSDANDPPGAPDLQWPLDGQKLTDIAVMFTVSDAGARQRIQVASDPDFNQIVEQRTANRVQLLKPENQLKKGTYYWRVRGLNSAGEAGDWSGVRSFTVDLTDHVPQEPVRPISSENPMFVGTKMPDEFVQDLDSRWPKSLQNLIVREKAGYSPGEEFPIPTLIKFGKGGTINLPKLEHAYRNSERVIGFLFREYGINEKFLRPALTLGAVHGRYAGTLNIGWDLGLDSWLSKDYYDLMDKYSRYMLPIQKLTNRRFPLPRIVTPSGAYLTGRIGNFGVETEWGTGWGITGWNRSAKGDIGMTTRPLNWTAPLVTGITSGACVYRLEAVAKNRYMSAWHKGWNGYAPLWKRALAPLLVDMKKHNLVPTREELLDRVKVGMATRRRHGVKSPGSPDTFFPNRILGALHGLPVDSVPREHVLENQWIPDSGRFHIVPVLPSYLPDGERKVFDRILKPWEFDHPRKAVEFAGKNVPPDRSEAYASLAGDTGVVINGIDERRDPNAGAQSFYLELTRSPVQAVKGSVDWHAYAVMKQKEKSLFLHVNNHKINYTPLQFTSRSGEPLTADVQPKSALASMDWKDQNGGVLTLRLNHYSGAVRVNVTRR